MSSSTFVQNPVTRFRETSVNLLEYAKANRDEGVFNDVTLQFGNFSIGANRMVLACSSTYFETMFKSKMKERYESNILITGVDGKIADTLIDYIYNGQITIDHDSVMDILAGADYFQLDEVKQFCFEYLINRISLDNWYDVQTAAKLYRSDQLHEQVSEFITNHFDKIALTLDFKTFTKNDLLAFVSNLNRSQINESSIYQAFMNWIKHSEQERKNDFSDLFQLIDLNRLSLDALQNISSENLIHENITCAKSVMLLFSKLMTEIEMKQNESKIIMSGGIENPKKVIEIFNCNCIEPKKYPDLPHDVLGHCLLKLKDVVFCIGGKSLADEPELYNTVYQMKLSDTNLKWSDVVPMNEKRGLFGAAVFCDHLVVAGGGNGKDCLSSIEYFDGSSSGWQMGPPMQEKKFFFSLVECNDNLFAIGGQDENDESLFCVERLESLDGQWEFVAPMLTKRIAVAGVSLNGCIYAIGGQSEDNESVEKTVERYDPKLNEWSYVCQMSYGRSWAGACVLNGRIFVAGGVDNDGELVKNIECYDPTENRWEIVRLSWNDGIRYAGALITI